ALGAPDAPLARDSIRDWRLQRIRSAWLRASEHAALPAGTGALRPHAGRASQSACAGAAAAGRIDQQYPGFMGEAESPAVAVVPACRSQRFWRHADGRKYFAR